MRTSINQKTIAAATMGVMVLLPMVAFAAIDNFCGILGLLQTIGNWFGTLVFIIAVIAILYSAFLFLTAGGNEESLTTAKKVLIYGIIGIAVALLATNAIKIIQATIGSTTGQFAQCSVTPIVSPTITF